MILCPTDHAHADEISTVQVAPTDQPVSDTSTVAVQITVETVQTKIDTAQATLSTSAQTESIAIVNTIQANVPNTDTQTAVQIATTQEPIKSAVESATVQIQEANTAINNAQVAVTIVESAQATLDSATATVEIKNTELSTAQESYGVAISNNEVAENNLNTQTPITIAAQAANAAARDANDVAQAAIAPAQAAVDTQVPIVETAQSNKNAAQAVVDANTTPGLKETIYKDTGYNNAPPLGAGYVMTTTTDTNGINEQWGSGGPVAGANDDFQVKWEGIWTPQYTGTQWITAPADDGVKLYLDGQLVINDWYDKGGGGSTATVQTTAGVGKTFQMWYYENGGGANVALLRYTGSGWQVVPGSEFSTSSATPEQKAALQSAITTLNNETQILNTLQNELNTAQTNADIAYQTYVDANQNMMTQESIQAPIQQAAWDTRAAVQTASENLTTANQNLTIAQENLTTANQNLTISLQTADSLANVATTAVNEAVSAMQNATQVTQNYYAEQARLAAEAEAARQAALAAEAAKQAQIAQARAEAAAQAQALAEAQAKAAAEAAAKAEADAKAAAEAQAKAEADALAAQQAADAKAAQDAADAKAKADQDAANAKAEADKAAAEQAAKDQAAKDAQAAADAAKAEQAAKDQAAKDAQAKADAAKAESDKAQAEKAAADKAAEDKAKADAIGVKPNSPDQLSDTVVKEAPKEVLVPHIQQDKAGVENGGIEFFGTKTAPQVVGEDGKLTPPAPPPGSGLPIPPDAITTQDTFIGQPGGTTFNAPDIAVPVILTPVTGAIAAVPGVQAVNQAYVALANIGNDMSPVTRKKAKKILVLTVAVAAIRRRFG